MPLNLKARIAACMAALVVTQAVSADLTFQAPAAAAGAAAVPAPAALTGTIVPPTQERSVVFSDRGRTYMVGLQSGRITVIDGTAPQPGPFVPTPGPVVPPGPNLTGLAKQVYDSLNAAQIDPASRKAGATALINAIEATLGEAGGLGITDPQAIVNSLATNAETANVNSTLRGWKLGDILAGANITSRDQLVKALEEIKTGLGAIK